MHCFKLLFTVSLSVCVSHWSGIDLYLHHWAFKVDNRMLASDVSNRVLKIFVLNSISIFNEKMTTSKLGLLKLFLKS